MAAAGGIRWLEAIIRASDPRAVPAVQATLNVLYRHDMEQAGQVHNERKRRLDGYGLDREHVLTVRIDPRSAGFMPAQLPALYAQLVERVRALPLPLPASPGEA